RNRSLFCDLHFFVPLAREQHDVAGACLLEAKAIALRRSGSMEYFAPDFCNPDLCSPTTASFMMASGSSERGLSEVRTTKSLPLPAASPINGRLVRSRS